jgi:hypothetical protein
MVTTMVWAIQQCWKYTKPNSGTNNYLEVLVNDETTTLEQLNHLCGTKHDVFFGVKIPRRKMLVEMKMLEVEKVKERTMDVI